MPSESMAISIVQHLSLISASPPTKGYYRSKLFVAPLSTTPLIAAAGPLFSILERLSVCTSLPVLSLVCENIRHELQAFHSRLSGKHYTPEVEALAHYILTATIDELLQKSYLRIYDEIPEYEPFNPQAHGAVLPTQGFFDIVLFIKDQPLQYLDMIELAYFCLMLGFEGEQAKKPQGRYIVEHLMEDLFQILKQHKVLKSYHLFKESKRMEIRTKAHKSWVIWGIAGGLLLGSITASYNLLENKARTVQFGHAMLAKLDN